MSKINLNDYVWVRLNERGRSRLVEHYEPLARYGIDPVESASQHGADAYGWTQFQLWELMQMFGPIIGMGRPVPFIGNEILTEKPVAAAPESVEEGR